MSPSVNDVGAFGVFPVIAQESTRSSEKLTVALSNTTASVGRISSGTWTKINTFVLTAGLFIRVITRRIFGVRNRSSLIRPQRIASGKVVAIRNAKVSGYI